MIKISHQNAKMIQFLTKSLYFVRSGYFHLTRSAGTLKYAGVYGYEWSSRGSSTAANGTATPSAYYFDFHESVAYPSSGPNVRWYVFPLRCLSTVLDI